MNKTKERILDVSAELFRQQGLAGTGVKQILNRANAPFGSLYHHFPGGKDELAAETIRRAGAQYAELVAGKLLAGPDLVANVRAAFRSAGQTLVDTDYADACPIETVALEVANTNEPLRLATAEVFESWLSGLTALLVANDVAKKKARPLAHVILSALEGAFVFARASRSTEALDACGAAMATLVAAAKS
ncbi:MAG: TetR/AcrR family transcriptional regulator [Acidimicrobiia bacterium]|nr:TetR/AcrR family transcriptional regulator [Acidimicrobiia bacterium]